MEREPGDQRRASLRASDTDREQFVETLRQHHADGRLTLEELTERTGRAYFWPIWPILGSRCSSAGRPSTSSAPGPRTTAATATVTAEPPSGVVRTMPG